MNIELLWIHVNSHNHCEGISLLFQSDLDFLLFLGRDLPCLFVANLFSRTTRAVTDASVVVMEILVPRALHYTLISCRDRVVFWLETYEKEGSILNILSLLEKSRQINTRYLVESGSCVRLRVAFSRIGYVRSTCCKFRMADDERRLQHVSFSTSGGKLSQNRKFETLLQLKNQFSSL